MAQQTAVLPGRPARTRARRRGAVKRTFEGWGFVAPATILILGLSIFPAGWAFLLSLEKWNGFSTPTFLGVGNYAEIVSDQEFWSAFGHTALYVVLFVPSSVLAGLLLALLLNKRIRFMGLYRTAIFVPFVVSPATTGVLTNYLFDQQFGIVNHVLGIVGLGQPGWLADPHQAMIVIAIMSLWGSAAFTTVIYLAALQDIPPELLEAAAIDGANRWQAFWKVVWPELAAVTVFVAIWQAVQATQLFDLVYTTTRGGPLNATETIVYYLWNTAFHQFQFGYGSAVSYVLFGGTLIVTLVFVLLSRRNSSEAI
ncbi:MAG: carbohydrate ABC transporter permease [Amnibacterium sp.]